MYLKINGLKAAIFGLVVILILVIVLFLAFNIIIIVIPIIFVFGLIGWLASLFKRKGKKNYIDVKFKKI